MTALTQAYYQFAIMLIGLSLVLGLVSRRRAFQKLGRLLPGMIAVPVALAAVSDVWAATPTLTRFALIAFIFIVVLPAALFSTPFGREVLASVVGNAVYDATRRPGCLGTLLALALGAAAVLAVVT